MFETVYQARPQYRAKLIEAGRFSDTHFEIDDEALKQIGSVPGNAPSHDVVAVPVPCKGNKAAPKRTLREPTLADMANNFTEATLEWSKAGFPVAQKEIALERASVCQNCPGGHWDAKARMGLGKCRHPRCGCSKLKWFLGTSKCPIGAWKS